jgi:hypothetical protein
MSFKTEKHLLDDGKDKDVTPNLSKSLSNDDIKSKYDEDELYDKNDIANSSKSTHSEEDIDFSEAFMNLDLDDLDKFDASLSTCLGDLFPVANKIDAPAIYNKHKVLSSLLTLK